MKIRNARLDAIAAAVGPSPKLLFFTALEPLFCHDVDPPGCLLVRHPATRAAVRSCAYGVICY
jgi:hypothetical protein